MATFDRYRLFEYVLQLNSVRFEVDIIGSGDVHFYRPPEVCHAVTDRGNHSRFCRLEQEFILPFNG